MIDGERKDDGARADLEALGAGDAVLLSPRRVTLSLALALFRLKQAPHLNS